MPEQYGTVGILGGMGPEATVDLMQRIISHTSAADDIDHVRCLVDQNPKVPSRIKYLLEGGSVSPGPCLADMARGLEANGADFLCIACNTAHNWHGEVAAAVGIPVLNIIEIASAAAAQKLGGRPGKVGILASPAVRLTGLYKNPLARLGLEPLYAGEDDEKRLLGVIRSIKAGDTGEDVRSAFAGIVRHLEERGADALIIACTELGVIGAVTKLPLVDAADALAAAIVEKAGGSLKQP